MIFDAIAEWTGTDSSLARAAVVACLETGEILVETEEEAPTRMLCDFLVTTASGPPELHPGDTVLVFLPASLGGRGCVLGRVGAYRKPAPRQPEVPDRVVIEAGKELTLKCGESLVSMRDDGKLLIRGHDVVSHARRTNRIKGGSVAIN